MPFQILPRGGVEGVIESIRNEAQASGREALGILVDANNDLPARWQSISDRLASLGAQTPATPPSDGLILDSADEMPRIGIWLMPDNRSSGELEDFIAEMIPDGDSVWPLSQDYVESIPPEDRKFIPGNTLRAAIHAWLAAREDPRQMGLAIRARDLEVDGPLCTHFTNWLKRLFA